MQDGAKPSDRFSDSLTVSWETRRKKVAAVRSESLNSPHTPAHGSGFH